MGVRALWMGDFRKWRNDERMPLICPTCQSVFEEESGHAVGSRLLCMGLFSMFWFGACPQPAFARFAWSSWHRLAKPKLAKRAKAGGPGRTRTCNQTVMSGRMSIGFVDFATLSFGFD